MTRPQLHLWALVAPALGLALVALALFLLRSSASQVLAMPAAIGNDPDRYYYTWQVFNGTGQDANDLHIRLQSMVNVSQVYTGVYNSFGPADSSSGYDNAAGVFKLNFSNALVAPAETMLVGLCSDYGTLALGPSNPSPLYWSAASAPLDPAPLFVGLDWQWSRPHSLQIGLVNSENVTLTLLSLYVLDPGTKLVLDDLNGDVAPGLAAVSDMTGGDVSQLPPGSTTYFTVTFDLGGTSFLPGHAPLLEPKHPYVVQAVFQDWNDAGTVWSLYSQGLSPLAEIFLPAVLRQ
jgi:hypothetical protein